MKLKVPFILGCFTCGHQGKCLISKHRSVVGAAFISWALVVSHSRSRMKHMQRFPGQFYCFIKAFIVFSFSAIPTG